MHAKLEKPKSIKEQKEIIEQATIKTTIINGRKVRIIPPGLSVTNKVFDELQL